uniref:PIR Superfamily Protein n=1 Tax=Strongyloides stercoralis TaxID=6248 RepID=A0A0K0DRZ4_STRER
MKCNKPSLNDEFFHLRLFLRFKYYYAMERFSNYWDHNLYEVAILHLMHALKAFEIEKNTINFMEGNCVELENMYNDLKLNKDKYLELYNNKNNIEQKILNCCDDCRYCYYKKILHSIEDDKNNIENNFLKNDEIYDIPLLTVYNYAKQMKKYNKKEKKSCNNKNIFKKFKNIYSK